MVTGRGIVEAEDDGTGLPLVLGIHDAHLGAAHAEGEGGGGGVGVLEEGRAVTTAAQRRVGDEAHHYVIGLAEEAGGEGVPGEDVLHPGGLHAQRPGDQGAGIRGDPIGHGQCPLAERVLAVEAGERAARLEGSVEGGGRGENRGCGMVGEDEAGDVRPAATHTRRKERHHRAIRRGEAGA